MAYAEGTEVAPEKSRAEIETVIRKYGASHFGFMTAPEGATIGFRVGIFQVRFIIPMLPVESFQVSPAGRNRTQSQKESACAQEERRRWRALALCVKAKLEAVNSGITTFEEEFMAHIVMPGGRTVAESLLPKISVAVTKNDTQFALEWKPEVPHAK